MLAKLTGLLFWIGIMSTTHATPTDPPLVRVEGVVLQGYATALAGATVRGSVGPIERAATSDENGHFDLGLLPVGEIALTVRGGDAETSDTFELDDSDAFIELHVEGGARDGRGRLDVTVLPAEGGEDEVAGLAVELLFPGRQPVSGTTDERGRLQLERLPSGMASLTVRSTSEVLIEDSLEVGWLTDEWLEIDLSDGLRRDLGFLRGSSWIDETELAGGIVRVTDSLSGRTREADLDEFGSFDFGDGVATGMYRVELLLDGQRLLESRLLLHPYFYLEISTADGIREGGSEQAGPDSTDDEFHTVTLFYGTDRRRTGAAEPADFYGAERGELELGRCEVSIPLDHQLGELESPSFWRFEFREDPEKHVVLLSVEPQPRDGFVEELRARVEATEARRAFVFVHGYNVTFEDAARRTGQMAYDLQFEGAPILYSWPSKGSLSGYMADEASVQYTVPQLEAFLRLVASESGAQVVHLIAHSMGNRAMTEALREITADPDGPRFDQVALVAPDIDADVFERVIAPRIAGVGTRITLYASSTDEALAASKRVHAAQRAGDTDPAAVVVPGIDTIDVTGLDSSFLGHSYFAENRSVISDLIYLLHNGTAPSERDGLTPVGGDPGYWRFAGADP